MRGTTSSKKRKSPLGLSGFMSADAVSVARLYLFTGGVYIDVDPTTSRTRRRQSFLGEIHRETYRVARRHGDRMARMFHFRGSRQPFSPTNEMFREDAIRIFALSKAHVASELLAFDSIVSPRSSCALPRVRVCCS